MRILIFVLCISSQIFSPISGALDDILDICCTAGSEWALTEYGRCDNYPSLVDGVSTADQPSCRAITEVCCIKQRHIHMCDKGKNAAQENMFCVVSDSEFGSEQFKECCQCCKLGLIAYSTGLSCNLLNYGGPCDRIFSACCTGINTSNFTTPPSIETTTPFLRSAISDENKVTVADETKITTTIEANQVDGTDSHTTTIEPETDPSENTDTEHEDGIESNSTSEIQPEVGVTGGSEIEEQNECELFPGELCDQICVDTEESYYCECTEGYLLMDDEKSCKEMQDGDCLVDEFLCDDGTCIMASYRCDGYVADCPDNSDEQGCNVDNLSTGTEENGPDLGAPDLCDFGNPCEQLCKSTESSIVCDCEEGYQLNIDGVSCTDIDECILQRYDCPDDKMCVNTRGSYMCCPIGSSYNPDKETCDFIHIDATVKPANSPQCMMGYVYSAATQRCEDIDECMLGVAECAEGLSCQNKEGGFDCIEPRPACLEGTEYNPETQRCEKVVSITCDQGFAYNEETKACEDVDECILGVVECPVGQSCMNTIGSYACERLKPACPSGTIYNFIKGRCEENLDCSMGYSYNPSTKACEDINECALKTDDCSESFRCENTVGSYFCRRILDCGTGYTTDRDSQRCIDIDECVAGTHNCHGNYVCKNTVGSFRCRPKDCRPGFRFNRVTGNCEKVNCPKGLKIYENYGRCLDINECAEMKNICKKHEQCENNYGSYRCINPCGEGYRRSEDGKRCEDVDECKEGIHDCEGDQVCINQRGRYVCRCPEGYDLRRGGRCADIDECSRYGRICPSNSVCMNTQGSFKCECSAGYRQDGPRCRDIDECFESKPCQHNCRNTHGSYSCYCNTGYSLADDRRSCIDIDECKRPYQYSRGTLCGGVCRNTPGSYECQCPAGWELLADKRSCKDVDECGNGEARCRGNNIMCYNIRGGYKCPEIDCPEGFVPLFNRENKNRVRCKRISFACSPGDRSCQSAPLSQSYNFLSFPENINIPADLFSMSGPRYSQKYYTWDLKLLNVTLPAKQPGPVQRVTRRHFRISDYDGYRAVVSIIQPVTGAQDVVLELYMMISDKNSYIGFAKSVITLYITSRENNNK